MRVIRPGDPEYPRGLDALADPPESLWVRGVLSERPGIAVVGTRDPDGRGLDLAHRCAKAAATAGASVVSGLAPGIDTAAHRGALAAGSHTLAVLPCGVDLPAGSENADLAASILAAGGGLLSEVPPGAPATTRTRIARDRLQAALSVAVVVVSAGIPCGTLHTAGFALATGRTLAVLRPPYDSEPYAGSPYAGSPYAGNAALIDPQGCDPGLLGLTGRLAGAARVRRPAADVVLADPGEVAGLVDGADK